MAEKLKRPLLASEVVHHKNEIRTDNRVSNLEILTSFEHKSLHRKGKLWPPATIAKMMKSAKRRASTPEFRKMASERAKRQWAEGNLGRAAKRKVSV